MNEQDRDGLPPLALIYEESMPGEVIKAFTDDVTRSGQPLHSESRPKDAFAGIEWYLPTAMLLWIGKSYFDSFLKEAGKDHYQVLKQATSKLWSNFFGENPKAAYRLIASSPEKLQGSHSISFSILGEIDNGQRIKLILCQGITEKEFEDAVRTFFEFLEVYHVSKTLPEEASARWNMIVVEYDPTKKALVFLNPSGNIRAI